MNKNYSLSARWQCNTCKKVKITFHTISNVSIGQQKKCLRVEILYSIYCIVMKMIVQDVHCRKEVKLTCTVLDNYIAIDFENQNVEVNLYKIQIYHFNGHKKYQLTGAIGVRNCKTSSNKDYKAYCKSIGGFWYRKSDGLKILKNLSKNQCTIQLAMLRTFTSLVAG